MRTLFLLRRRLSEECANRGACTGLSSLERCLQHPSACLATCERLADVRHNPILLREYQELGDMGFYEAVEAGVPAPARPEDHVAIVLLCDPADGIAFEVNSLQTLVVITCSLFL